MTEQRKYVGARYVPLIMGEWDSSASYEPLSVVLYNGKSYTSRTFVPAGILITNEVYWALSGGFNADEDDSTKSYETVADMQADTTLTAGMICHTLGFHAVEDGGAAWYKVESIGTANGMDIIALSSGVAVLQVTEAYVTPEMFGAYGDGVHDDTASMQSAITSSDVRLTKTYLVTANNNGVCISIPSNRSLMLDGATVAIAANALDSYSIFSIKSVENVKIYGNGFIIGDRATHTGLTGEWGHCINIVASNNVVIDGISCNQAWGDGCYIGEDNDNNISEKIYINNCIFDGNSRNGISVVACDGCYITNCIFIDNDRVNPKSGFDIEPNNDSIINVIVDNALCVNNLFSIVNDGASSNYNVTIGTVKTIDAGFIIDVSSPNSDLSIVTIDNIDTIENNAVNNYCSVNGSSNAFVTINNININFDTISILFYSTGIANFLVKSLNLNGNTITSLISNTVNVVMHIESIIMNATYAPKYIDDANLTIDEFKNNPEIITTSTTPTGLSSTYILTNDNSMITLTMGYKNVPNNFVLTFINNSSIAHRYTPSASIVADESGIISNVAMVQPNTIVRLKYNKSLNMFYTL